MKTKDEILANFSDRQVILNYYEDEQLIKKDGLFFEIIEVSEYEIKFLKGYLVKAAIDCSRFNKFEVGDTFKNYFKLKYDDYNYVEIYFP